MRKLTIEILSEHEPCKNGRDLFVRLFPKGTYCTKRDLDKMVRAGNKCDGVHDWVCWAACHVLNMRQYATYTREKGKRTYRYEEGTIRAFGKAWRTNQ